MVEYKTDLNRRYWAYCASRFPDRPEYFDRAHASDSRPPVFRRREAWRNVLTDPDAKPDQVSRLINLIPEPDRHKWFCSMNSSQALAQSVLGNLAVHGLLGCLAELADDEGLPLLGAASTRPGYFRLEHKVGSLGERRPTSLDGFICGSYQVAIECKFTEAEVGPCSRPPLARTGSGYPRRRCCGDYVRQDGAPERCPLTERGVLYWRYVPVFFRWDEGADLIPCPLDRNYQLVRNILAAGVRPDRTASLTDGHALLLYDERNPAFQDGGEGLVAYTETRRALREPAMLRKCSWQRITTHLKERRLLPWLTEQLALKYGL